MSSRRQVSPCARSSRECRTRNTARGGASWEPVFLFPGCVPEHVFVPRRDNEPLRRSLAFRLSEAGCFGVHHLQDLRHGLAIRRIGVLIDPALIVLIPGTEPL